MRRVACFRANKIRAPDTRSTRALMRAAPYPPFPPPVAEFFVGRHFIHTGGSFRKRFGRTDAAARWRAN